MGLQYFPIGTVGFPYEFAKQFIDKGYTNFVETGTYQGETALKASSLFKEVFTVEAAEVYFDAAVKRCAGYDNIHCYLGESSKILSQVLPNVQGETVFWLDAHFSGGDTHQNECPLEEELDVINEFSDDAIIVIDDARYVTSYYLDEWYMEAARLYQKIYKIDRVAMQIGDRIICVPRKFEYELVQFLRQVTTDEWRVFMKFVNSRVRKLLMMWLKYNK